MPKIPDSTKDSLHWRPASQPEHSGPTWPTCACATAPASPTSTASCPDGHVTQLCRLRYLRSATTWGSAIYRASHDDYEDNYLPTGSPTGTAEEALDCACGRYLADPNIWTLHPTTFQRRGPLATR